MPININADLPAAKTLLNEGIFVMLRERATMQDIRPLRIIILNIMPTKIETETQLLRLLANTPLQLEITLLRPKTHTAKNTPAEHLDTFYKTFEEIKSQKFDGMIITGAPIELLDFDEVTYWDELVDIMSWTLTNVFSTMHICWGAQAGLNFHYNIPKYETDEKVFGVFQHDICKRVNLVRGFDDYFWAPHSRHTQVTRADIEKVPELTIVCESQEAGVYLVYAKNGRQIFVTGHSEYDADTLKKEYLRDIEKGLKIAVPKHYFPNDDPSQPPMVKWRSHATLMFSNWLNYYVYQQTPYDINAITQVD